MDGKGIRQTDNSDGKAQMTDRSHLTDEQRDSNPGAGEQAGEAIGGVGGAVAGASVGSLAGPVGTVVGGIAGAVGGWWAGEKAGRTVEDMGDHDEDWRRRYSTLERHDVDYDDARIGYGVGHLAGRNPDYRGRSFEDVEDDLRRGWTHDRWDYDTLRPYVRQGWEQGRTFE